MYPVSSVRKSARLLTVWSWVRSPHRVEEIFFFTSDIFYCESFLPSFCLPWSSPGHWLHLYRQQVQSACVCVCVCVCVEELHQATSQSLLRNSTKGIDKHMSSNCCCCSIAFVWSKQWHWRQKAVSPHLATTSLMMVRGKKKKRKEERKMMIWLLMTC